MRPLDIQPIGQDELRDAHRCGRTPSSSAVLYPLGRLRPGLGFSPNFQLNPGQSDNTYSASLIYYGHYQGLAYQGGYLRAVWADNSNSTGANPDGTHKEFDIYTCRVAY